MPAFHTGAKSARPLAMPVASSGYAYEVLLDDQQVARSIPDIGVTGARRNVTAAGRQHHFARSDTSFLCDSKSLFDEKPPKLNIVLMTYGEHRIVSPLAPLQKQTSVNTSK